MTEAEYAEATDIIEAISNCDTATTGLNNIESSRGDLSCPRIIISIGEATSSTGSDYFVPVASTGELSLDAVADFSATITALLEDISSVRANLVTQLGEI